MISFSATDKICIALSRSAFHKPRWAQRLRSLEFDGAVSLKVPEGTQSGKELRIRGRGVPYLNEKGRGDLVVKVVVQIPKKLTRAQRELVAQLAESLAIENKPTAPGLIDKVKDLFS